MTETEEVTVLIDLDRIPEDIGYIRQNKTKKGVYNHRVYMQEDYEKVLEWASDCIGNISQCRLVIQGNLPNTIIMGLGIGFSEDPRVNSIYHGKFGDLPMKVWDVEHGVVL